MMNIHSHLVSAKNASIFISFQGFSTAHLPFSNIWSFGPTSPKVTKFSLLSNALQFISAFPTTYLTESARCIFKLSSTYLAYTKDNMTLSPSCGLITLCRAILTGAIFYFLSRSIEEAAAFITVSGISILRPIEWRTRDSLVPRNLTRCRIAAVSGAVDARSILSWNGCTAVLAWMRFRSHDSILAYHSEYAAMAVKRIEKDQGPLFAEVL